MKVREQRHGGGGRGGGGRGGERAWKEGRLGQILCEGLQNLNWITCCVKLSPETPLMSATAVLLLQKRKV